MQLTCLKRILFYSFFGTLTTLVLLGCRSTVPSMAIVEKNVEERRITAQEAVQDRNILNEYHHLLEPPQHELLAVRLLSDQSHILKKGGETFIQVGLASRPPQTSTSHLHFLVFVPQLQDEQLKGELRRLTDVLEQRSRILPTGSQVSVDWNYPTPFSNQLDAVLPHQNADDLGRFVRRFVLHPFEGDKHRIILVVGKHGGLSQSQQQNLVDMAEVFTANSVTFSTLAIGEKPDFAFLEKLSQRGQGLFRVMTTEMDMPQWIEDEVADMHASPLKDIQVQLELGSGVSVVKYLSDFPRSLPGNRLELRSPDLQLGEQRAFLAKVSIPPSQDQSSLRLMRATVSYYDPIENKYHTTQDELSIAYTDDINQSLTQHNTHVQRSLLILKTAETIQNVATEVRNDRIYKGMAILKQQSRSLRKMGNDLQDKELLRDARVLDRYAKRLFEFSEESFQTFKIWRDLNWDTDRYEDELQ